jgi:hypothetical protein
MESLLEELAPDAAVGCTAPTSSDVLQATDRSGLPVPLLPPLALGGQHAQLRQRPRWPSGPPKTYGPDGDHPPPDATKRRPAETPIASAKRWRESRTDAAPTSAATCAEAQTPNPAG